MHTAKVLLPVLSLASELVFFLKKDLFPIKTPLFKMAHYDKQGMYAISN